MRRWLPTRLLLAAVALTVHVRAAPDRDLIGWQGETCVPTASTSSRIPVVLRGVMRDPCDRQTRLQVPRTGATWGFTVQGARREQMDRDASVGGEIYLRLHADQAGIRMSTPLQISDVRFAIARPTGTI